MSWLDKRYNRSTGSAKAIHQNGTFDNTAHIARAASRFDYLVCAISRPKSRKSEGNWPPLPRTMDLTYEPFLAAWRQQICALVRTLGYCDREHVSHLLVRLGSQYARRGPRTCG